MWRAVGKFPIYAAAEVKNPIMLVATLTAIRTMLGQVAPGWVEWGESGKYRELAIVRIGASRTAPVPNREMVDAIALHYVQTGSAFVLALNVETLKHVVDRLLDGAAPKAAPEGPAQFVFEGRSEPGAPLWTALLWLVQGQANNAQAGARRSAEILLRGDPALQTDPQLLAQRGLDHFGYAPVTAQGDSNFVLKPEGVGDAVSGTDIAPIYGVLPIPGSPVDKLMQHLTRLRGEVSFDKEPAAAGPNARSLHTRFELELERLEPEPPTGVPAAQRGPHPVGLLVSHFQFQLFALQPRQTIHGLEHAWDAELPAMASIQDAAVALSVPMAVTNSGCLLPARSTSTAC